tara:strand:+ start:47542 stop:48810 length:1269 start_codon:yes stop_codon:yes gene_type:complete
MKHSVIISKVGQTADGIATLSSGETVYVPNTLPNEEVVVELGHKKGKAYSSQLIEIKSPSPERNTPPCPYYGKCGGCSAQHMSPKFYLNWKKGIVLTALKRHGINTDLVDQPVILPSKARRRTNLKASMLKGKLAFGYRQKSSHDIVNVDNCLVLRPELAALFAPLKRFLGSFLKNKDTAEIWMSITNGQIDLYLDLPKTETLNYEQREELADFAKCHNLARLTVKTSLFEDPVFSNGIPQISFAGTNVAVSANRFLQASDEADQALTGQMLQFLEGAHLKKVADLFCGRGTFSFAFNKDVQVDGFEADKPALNALNDASQMNKMKVKGIYKNLFSDPLMTSELNAYDAIVLDPPRDGAKEQSQNMAQSSVKHIVYISCSPNSFARDAEILVQGGYEIQKIVPIDQFLWTNHIEVIALFIKR